MHPIGQYCTLVLHGAVWPDTPAKSDHLSTGASGPMVTLLADECCLSQSVVTCPPLPVYRCPGPASQHCADEELRDRQAFWVRSRSLGQASAFLGVRWHAMTFLRPPATVLGSLHRLEAGIGPDTLAATLPDRAGPWRQCHRDGGGRAAVPGRGTPLSGCAASLPLCFPMAPCFGTSWARSSCRSFELTFPGTEPLKPAQA